MLTEDVNANVDGDIEQSFAVRVGLRGLEAFLLAKGVDARVDGDRNDAGANVGLLNAFLFTQDVNALVDREAEQTLEQMIRN